MHPTNNLLEKTELLFKNVRSSVMEAAGALYECEQSKVWEEKYSTWSEFVEQGCGVSKGFAAKLLKSYKYYAVEGGYTTEELKDIDAEKLYLSIGLKGNTEEQLNKAQTLSRQEIKSELAVKDGKEHEHEFINICRICGVRN